MTDAEMLLEIHWCLFCTTRKPLHPIRVIHGRWSAVSVDLVVPCPCHGEHFHAPHEVGCSCTKDCPPNEAK